MKKLLSVDDALNAIIANRLPRPPETVPLDAALGARLVSPLTAKVSRPPAAVSAMDGYAVRLADVSAPNARLRVVGEAPAGTPFDQTVAKAEAVRIFTGGELPSGTDHIVIQEDVDREANHIVCRNAYTRSECVRTAGLDFNIGDVLIPAGTPVGAADIALAAAANHASLNVEKRLRVGILANGDELKPPGSTLKRGEIINSNPVGLSALIRDWGGVAVDLGIAARQHRLHSRAHRCRRRYRHIPAGWWRISWRS